MKYLTERNKERSKKITAVFAALAIGFTQIMPFGFADTLAPVLTQNQQEVSIEEVGETDFVPADEALSGHEMFFNDSPLSAPEPVDDNPLVTCADGTITHEGSCPASKEELEETIEEVVIAPVPFNEKPTWKELPQDNIYFEEARERYGDKVAAGESLYLADSYMFLDAPTKYRFKDANGNILGELVAGGLGGAHEWTDFETEESPNTSPVEKALDVFDQNEDGLVSGNELIDGMRDLWKAFASRPGDPYYDVKFDFDQNGIISFDDLAPISMLFENHTDEYAEASLNAFYTLDVNDDYILSADEMITGYKKFNKLFGTKEGDAEFDAFYDFNQDGEINFNDTEAISIITEQLSEEDRVKFEDFLAGEDAIKQVIISDLKDNLGIENIDEAIAEGKIRITLDLVNEEARVEIIDASIVSDLKDGEAALSDLLGARLQPNLITYKLGYEPGAASFHLLHASFQVGTETYSLKYDPDHNNRLISVAVTHAPEECDGISFCTAGPKFQIETIEYTYHDGGITAKIHDFRSINSREVEIKRLADGKLHIMSIKETQGLLTITDGEDILEETVISVSNFNYLSIPVVYDCAEGEVCLPPAPEVRLRNIERTDAEGRVTSTITNIEGPVIYEEYADRATTTVVETAESDTEVVAFPEPIIIIKQAYSAKVTLSDGTATTVYFNSYEELLNQVSKFESRHETYYDKLATLDEFMSGLSREGITLEEVIALRRIQDELKSIIDEMIANGEEPGEELIKGFKDRVEALDRKLAQNVFLIPVGDDVVEVSTSELMRILSEEYTRLRPDGSIDYTRLPGVTPEDLEGLETFKDYLNRTQIGVSLDIPVFKQFSSFGHLVLIQRLVQKYGDKLITGDWDHDGHKEIDRNIFRRMINGTQLAYEAALELIETLTAEAGIEFPHYPVTTFSHLADLTQRIHDLNETVKLKTKELFDSLTMEDVFKNQMVREINAVISSDYSQNKNDLSNMIRNAYQNNLFSGLGLVDINYPEGDAISPEDALNLLAQLDSFKETLEGALSDLFDSLDVASDLVNIVRSQLDNRINYRGDYYYEIHKRVNDFINSKNFIYEIDGVGTVTISAAEMNVMTGNLPRDIESLLKFPGIKDNVTEEELKALESAAAAWARRGIEFPGSSGAIDSENLSGFAVRNQLMQILLNAFGEKVITNGEVNVDHFRRELLMNDHLENLYDGAISIIDSAINRIRGVREASGGVLSPEDYEGLYKILSEANEAVVALMKLSLSDLIYEARSLITGMVQAEFNRLNSALDQTLNTSQVEVVINGVSHTVDASEVEAKIRELLKMVSVNQYGQRTNEMFARLAGISESLAGSLKATSELNLDRTINFDTRYTNYNAGLGTVADTREIWFKLIPAVLEGFGDAILNEEGQISLELIERSLLNGIDSPVEPGESLLEAFKSMLNERLGNVTSELNAIDFSIWHERLRAEELMQNFVDSLAQEASKYVQLLNSSEIVELSNILNYRNDSGAGDLRDVWNLFNRKMAEARVVKVTMDDGTVVTVDLNRIASIERFPHGKQFDAELFLGLRQSDFENTDKKNQRYVRLRKDGEQNAPSVSFDRDRLIVNIVRRIYSEQNEIPELFTEDLFYTEGDQVLVNREKMRRLLKGVDLLHRDIKEQVEEWTAEELEALEALKTVPMTVESIRLIQERIRAYQAKLIEYMNDLTHKHEKQDVIEMEEDVTATYKQMIDSMLDYVRSNPLTVQRNGVEIVIPVAELVEKLNSAVSEKFPDEEIGAHHFASFFGVSMEDVRGYDKLENFLGMQIIALPRNSQYVEILSKLSEVGYMELLSDAIKNYGDQVVSEEGAVDVDELIRLLSDADAAVLRAKELAEAVTAEVEAKMAELEMPLTSETFEQIKKLFDQGKLDLINVMNDFVAGFSEEMFDEVQAHVDALYAQLVEARRALILSNPIVIKGNDGSEFEINLADLEEPVVTQILLLLQSAGQTEETHAVDSGFRKMDEPVRIELQRSLHYGIDEYFYGVPQPIIRMPIGITPITIWQPFAEFNPEDTLTEFGLYNLIVRLAKKYGDFATSENGAFSLENFLRELDRTDSERATERFSQIEADTADALNEILGDGESVSLERVERIHAFLDEAREKFLAILNPLTHDDKVIDAANAAWSRVMTQYEQSLFAKKITLNMDGRVYVVEGEALVQIIRDEYENKMNTEFLDEYLKDGETPSEYSGYKTLYRKYYRTPEEGNVRYKDMEEEELEASRYPFNLGMLQNLKGITSHDLSGLGTEQKDKVMLTLIEDTRTLLMGRLNMRVFAPGASIQNVGLQNMVQTNAVMRTMDTASLVAPAYDRQMVIIGGWEPWRPWRRNINASERDLLFRVLPAILKDYKEVIFNAEGDVDEDKFRSVLRGDYTLPEEGYQMIADHLGVDAENIHVESAEKRDALFCRELGCATWSRYVSLTVEKDGQRKHYAGVITGGEKRLEIIDYPFYKPAVEAVVNHASETPLENVEQMYEAKDVAIVETNQLISGRAAQAIAKAVPTELKYVTQIDYSPSIVCVQAPCPSSEGRLRVIVNEPGQETARYRGTMKQKDDHDFEIHLEPAVKVLDQMAFGYGRVIIEDHGEGKMILKLQVPDFANYMQGRYTTLREFEIDSYKSAFPRRIGSFYSNNKLTAWTLDGKKLEFLNRSFWNRHQSLMRVTEETEFFRNIKTYALQGSSLRKISEKVIRLTDNRREIVQNTVWDYKKDELSRVRITRRAEDGSSVRVIKKTGENASHVKVTVYKPSQGYVFKGQLTRVRETLDNDRSLLKLIEGISKKQEKVTISVDDTVKVMIAPLNTTAIRG